MFTIRARCVDTIEVRSGIDSVRGFFANVKNFVESMPGVESIFADAKGVNHWKIAVQVPLVGDFSQRFAVARAEDSPERIEWMPMAGETHNFLRYSADFQELGSGTTLVNYLQMVELRRRSAKDLHLLAGVAGESMISNEMSKHIAGMIRTFINKAKEKLEK
jgi:carbon monoxide dehydrogenase subunit G